MAKFDFSKVTGLKTPRGNVSKISVGGKVLWENTLFRYVSLGDSIAAGQNIREEERLQIGEDGKLLFSWQYGTEGVSSTEIITGTYTDLIRKRLCTAYGDNRVDCKSFARSGDVNTQLRDKLNDAHVQKYVKNADLITVSIGANTILGPAMGKIGDYALKGTPTLAELDTIIENGCKELEADANTYGSYRNIFTKIAQLNKKENAKFVFQTVYNPYKYLWLDPTDDDHNYENGYFSPIFTVAPNIETPGWWQAIGGQEIDIRKFLYESAYMPEITQRINDPYGDGRCSLADWVESKLERLNGVIKKAINDFGDKRFMVADTKAVWDGVPDKHLAEQYGEPSSYNYTKLNDATIVRGETIATLDWANFWKADKDSLVAKITAMVEGDIDPHPAETGHNAIYCAFMDALGWEKLTRYTVSFSTGTGASGTMANQIVIALPNFKPYLKILSKFTVDTANGYYFVNWEGSNGQKYDDGETIRVDGNLLLNAQWSNKYTLTVRHSHKAGAFNITGATDEDTGPTQYYEVWYNGNKIIGEGAKYGTMGQFKNPPKTIDVTYGDSFGVIVSAELGDKSAPYIQLNGGEEMHAEEMYDGNIAAARSFIVLGDVEVNLEWNYQVITSIFNPKSYWKAFVSGNAVLL